MSGGSLSRVSDESPSSQASENNGRVGEAGPVGTMERSRHDSLRSQTRLTVLSTPDCENVEATAHYYPVTFFFGRGVFYWFIDLFFVIALREASYR